MVSKCFSRSGALDFLGNSGCQITNIEPLVVCVAFGQQALIIVTIVTWNWGSNLDTFASSSVRFGGVLF